MHYIALQPMLPEWRFTPHRPATEPSSSTKQVILLDIVIYHQSSVQTYTGIYISDRSLTLGNNITQPSLITVVKFICEDRGPHGSGNHATQMLLYALSILLLVFNVPLFLCMLQKRNEQLVIVSNFISSFYLKISQCLQSSQQTETEWKALLTIHIPPVLLYLAFRVQVAGFPLSSFTPQRPCLLARCI